MSSRSLKPGLPLECLIESKSEHQPGGPIIVKGALHNSGPSVLWILSWNTFLEEDWPDCLSVTHNGEPVPYIGTLAARSDPPKESYVRIAPSESRSREIDISQKYAITEPGDYQVCFRMHLWGAPESNPGEWPEDQIRYVPLFSESAKVTIRITGSAAARPIEARSFSLESSRVEIGHETLPSKCVDPVLDGMTPGENTNFFNAHHWAYKSIVAAVHKLEKDERSYAYDVVMDTYPSSEKAARRQTVAATFRQMATKMAANRVTYRHARRDSPDGRTAQTTLNTDSPIIDLFKKAFEDDYLRFSNWMSAEWCRALIVVHEIAHCFGGVGMDITYYWYQCTEMAKYDPPSALKNAHNYALFAMHNDQDAPVDVAPDNGIWKWAPARAATTADSPAATAASMGGESVVFVVNRGVPTEGEEFWYTFLRRVSGQENWADHRRLEVMSNQPVSGSRAPAVAASGTTLHWAYIDKPGADLLYVEGDASGAYPAQGRFDVRWGGSIGKPMKLASCPWGASPGPSPALACLTSGPNAGVFCVYGDENGKLKCKARMEANGIWLPVPLDKDRSTDATPALAVFNGEIRCAYLDKDTYGLVMLAYKAAGNAQVRGHAGTWHEVTAPPIQTDTIALSQWDTSVGPRLVAFGKGKGGNTNFRYSVADKNLTWSPEARLATFSSPTGAALAACGSALYAFYRRADNAIEALVAT